MHLKDVVLSVACSIKHTYLENRILKICDKFFLRNIKDIRGASKDAKPKNIKARCKHKTNQGCNAMHLRWNPYPRRKSTG